MNIFYFDDDPAVCAQWLDDKRGRKLILEMGQVTSTALRALGVTDARLYKATHTRHPVVRWAGENRSNFEWVCAYGLELAAAHKAHTGRAHASSRAVAAALSLRASVPHGARTGHPNCAANAGLGLCFRHISDVTEAYKKYYAARLTGDKLEPTWSEPREKPEWLKHM